MKTVLERRRFTKVGNPLFDWIERILARRPVRIRARVVGHVDVSAHTRQTLEGQSFVGVDFSGGPWDQWMAIDCRFERCKFGGLRVRDGEPYFGGGPHRSLYLDCNFDGANLRHFSPGRARFERCTFHRVIISDGYPRVAEFVDCSFSGRIRDTVFWARAPFPQDEELNEFVRNDFSQCVLDGVSFRGGIRVSDQRLPESTEYLYVADLAAVLNHLRTRRPDPEHRLLQKVITTILASDLETGQSDAFYVPRSFGDGSHESDLAAQWFLEACGLLPHRRAD